MNKEMQTEAARESQVNEVMNYLERSLEELSQNITNLESRLAGVLREPNPSDSNASTGEKVEQAYVPIAGRMRKNNNYLQDSINRLLEIQERIEL